MVYSILFTEYDSRVGWETRRIEGLLESDPLDRSSSPSLISLNEPSRVVTDGSSGMSFVGSKVRGGGTSLED